MTLRTSRDWFNIGLISLIVFLVLGYALFQSRKILEGPLIEITSPLNASTIENDPLVEITGTANNIKEISLNDRSIFVDEQGNFREKLLLSDGYNIIKLEAKDKFGKMRNKNLYLIFRNS